jgi:hypothetical protein
MRKSLLRNLAASVLDRGTKQELSRAVEHLPDAAAIIAMAAVYSWWVGDWWLGMSTGTLSAALGYLTVVWMGDLIPGFGWLIGRHQPQGD